MRVAPKIALVVLALLAVAAMAALGSRDGDDEGGGGDTSATRPAGGKPRQGDLKVRLAVSPEKEKLIADRVRAFNAAGKVIAGRRVFAELQIIASGEAADKIVRGRFEPHLWSPASSLWGRRVNFELDRPVIPRDSPSLVRTPLVLALWRPQAEALGYPRRRLGFADVARLAADPAGWAGRGHPEWGAFRYAQTSPDFSTSGLSAMTFQYFAAAGKREGLTERDVRRAQPAVQRFQRSVVHYGDTTSFIADEMRRGGLGYTSAVAMEEATLIDFNTRRGRQPELVAIYPKEGTFVSDNPLIIPDAGWVSAVERQGAELLRDYLIESIDPADAARYGFRSADRERPYPSPVPAGITAAGPSRVLALPEPRTLAAISDAWSEDRKPANALVVFDLSGSMNEAGRLEAARKGLVAFTREFSSRDRIGLLTFNDQVGAPLVAPGPGRETLPRIRQLAPNLIADGGTAIYDAATVGADLIRRQAGTDRINAVVLMTDGEDTDSQRSMQQAVSELNGQGDSARRVRIFPIAYSAGAEGAEEGLQALAQASGGKLFSGDTDDIVTVFRSVASFL